MLKHMAYECGFDYLLLRFDRVYRFDSLTVSATYYFSATPQTLRFDSSIVRYGPAVAKKTLFFPCVSCNAIKSWLPSKPGDTSFAEKLRLIDKAEGFAKSFSSAMLARSKVGGLRIAFSFGLAGESYVLDERTGVTNTTLPHNVRGIDTGCGSYKLAYFFNPERGLAQNKDLVAGPWIRDVTLAYTPTQQISVTFTAASDTGLREVRFWDDSYQESVYLKGTKREGVTKALRIDSSHYRLAITVFDIGGRSASVSYPVFEDKRETGRIAQSHRKRLEQERMWAEKSTFNEALYTVGQLDGNIALWVKAISDALVDSDIRKDATQDAAMKEAVRKKSAPPDTASARKPSPPPDTKKTGAEIIGE
jgi:hypothetical protein